DHALRVVAQVARHLVRDGAEVHPDADRGPLLLRALHDLADAVLVVDVARVQAELVDLRVERHERQLVVEMDVRDDRQDAPPDQLFEGLAGAAVWDRDAHDLAAGLLQAFDLPDRGLDVVGERGAHGLDGDRSAVADRDPTDPDALARPADARSDAVLRKIEIDVHGSLHSRLRVAAPGRPDVPKRFP